MCRRALLSERAVMPFQPINAESDAFISSSDSPLEYVDPAAAASVPTPALGTLPGQAHARDSLPLRPARNAVAPLAMLCLAVDAVVRPRAHSAAVTTLALALALALALSLALVLQRSWRVSG